jgi:hypothetical protein
MPWVTKFWPLIGEDRAEGCQQAGCQGSGFSRVTTTLQFFKENGDTDRERSRIRSKILCDVHAFEIREKLRSDPAGIPPVPEPEQEPAPLLTLPTIPHTCHARGCSVRVPPKLLMCARHWRMVPPQTKADIWAHYRPGQEVDKRVTKEYLFAMEMAINCVAAAEKDRVAPALRSRA